MMRMKGHAIHDAAAYVPKPMFEFWKKRDPIARFENYLVKEKKWLTANENAELIAEVERVIEAEREIAVNSPMPTPESAEAAFTAKTVAMQSSRNMECRKYGRERAASSKQKLRCISNREFLVGKLPSS